MRQRYDSYKPSGIDWIGDIPSHWNLKRMRYLCDIITGDKDTVNRVDDGLYPFYVRSPQIERINTYSFDGEAVLMAGDGVGAGKVLHYATGKFDFHQRVYNFHNFREIEGKLLYLYLKSLFKYKIEEGGAKNTVDSVRQPWLKDFPVCIPPRVEQEAIVTWVDEKCGEIDAAIAKVDREIELIDELKQSEISRVVTRGLNPDAPLRPSGINWIGNVPEHWEICKIKHKADIVLGKMLLSEPPKEHRNIYSKEKYLKSRNIGWLNLLLEEVEEMWFNESEKSLYKLNDGDVLVNEGGDIGKVAIWHDQEDSFYIQNSVHKISPIGVNSEFLAYWIFSLSKRNYFWSIVSQVSIAHLTKEKLSNAPLIVPPLSEQRTIADYLDAKCADIDGLKAKLTKKRETLTELRQSIISEVVTGKRRVAACRDRNRGEIATKTK